MRKTRKLWIVIGVGFVMALLYVAIFLIVFQRSQSDGPKIIQDLKRVGVRQSTIEQYFSEKKNMKGAKYDTIQDPIKSSLVDVPAAELSALANTYGLYFTLNDKYYFYPFEHMSTREVINDTIDGQPILVTYCTTCNTGAIFERAVNGVPQQFRATDYLWEGGLIMHSGESQTQHWIQASGEEIAADGSELDYRFYEIMGYEQFVEKHPDGMILRAP